MRYLMGLLLTVACVTAFAGTPPKPKPPAMSATLSVAGDSVKVKWTVAASPSDSLTVDVAATGRVAKHKMYTADVKTDSVNFVKPIPGDTITISLLAKNWRGVKSAPAPLASGIYAEPDTMVSPPSVQLQITPVSATVLPGGSVQFQVSTNSGQPVTWTLVGEGTLTQTGLYTAPL